jgi:hypothetical protein
MVIIAAVPLACAPPASNRAESAFVGNWATGENASITIRPDTIIQHQPDGQSTALDMKSCRGVFRFTYGMKTRQALIGLLPRQPELQRRLSDLLVESSYPVAELACDRGDQTYVLINDRQLLVIYRDGDIGAIERLARS